MNWDEVRFFHAVVNAGSLAGAARLLRVSQPTVSRRIRDLETHLEARLFDRLCNGFELTDLGRGIFEHAEGMAHAARSISDKVQTATDKIAGRIHLTAPDGLGAHWLMPRLPRLKSAHPDLDVQLMLSTETINIAAGDADLAVRMGDPRDENLFGRQVASVPFHLYGSREYFSRHKVPACSNDLHAQKIIECVGRLEHTRQCRALRDVAQDAQISITCDNLMAQLNATQAGMGLAPLPPYLLTAGIDLVQVPASVFEVQVPVWVLTRPDLKNCPRIIAVKQFVAQAAKRSFALRRGTSMPRVA